MIEVLLLHRCLDRAAVLAGISDALSFRSTSADVVAVEARKAASDHGVSAEPDATASRFPERVQERVPERVPSLTERRLAVLPVDDRPLPSVDRYDQLLAGGSS